jgi:hypothetical protein
VQVASGRSWDHNQVSSSVALCIRFIMLLLSESTICRRRRELGLRASGLTTRSLPDAVKRQLVLDQMAKDPEGKLGAKTIKAGIFKDTGIDITR